MVIKAVLFDFGGVLGKNCMSFQEYGNIVIEKLRKEGVNLANIDPSELGKWFTEKFEEIYWSAIERRLEDLLYEYLTGKGIKITRELAKKIISEMVEIDYCELNPEAEYVLKTLKDMGLILGLVSNWLDWFPRAFLERRGLAKYFDLILLSYDIGIRKPRKEIFEEAIKRLKINPEETLYVGDLEWTDVEGSHKVGMMAVLYDPSGSKETKAEYKIRSLKELIDIVRKENI